jgi:hypothetical protein
MRLLYKPYFCAFSVHKASWLNISKEHQEELKFHLSLNFIWVLAFCWNETIIKKVAAPSEPKYPSDLS